MNLVVGARNVLADPCITDTDNNNSGKDDKDKNESNNTQQVTEKGPYSIDDNIEKAIKESSKKNGGYNVVMHNNSKDIDKKPRSSITQYNFTKEQEYPTYYIASNQRLSKILEYKRILSEFIEMMKSVEDQHSYCRSKIVESDREIQDFLHELRQPKRNAYEGFKLYQLGHHLEIKRQGYKDADEDVFYLAKFMNNSKEFVEKLESILNHLKEVETSRENKIYMPRSSLNLPVGDKFRALSKKEQEVICRNFEKTKTLYRNQK